MSERIYGPREKLKHIPLPYDDESYLDRQKRFMWWFQKYYRMTQTVRGAVAGEFYHGADSLMDENGIERAVGILAGMLFQMQYSTLRDPVDRELAQVAWEVIKDLDTGEYYDLMSEEDAEFMKMDVRKVRSYLKEHPGLLWGS